MEGKCVGKTDKYGDKDSGSGNIVLIGMPAAGKTTVGCKLAQKLECNFVDIDEEIEKDGMAIAQIFEIHGENHFRKLESETIKRVAHGTNQVIALGGGAFEDEQTRELLLENAFVIYLKTPLDIIKERMAASSHRPLTDIDALYEKRAANYEKAHLTLELKGKEHLDETINLIGRKNDLG
jgi:shikimate kinase